MFNLLETPASPKLAWSILLHDIGKKAAFTLDSDNIPHFYSHETIGADMAAKVAARLRFSNELQECVVHAVRNHMRFASVCEMRVAKVKRLLAEKDFAVELELHRLDCKASNGLTATYDFLCAMLQKFDKVLPPRLIGGNDLIKLGYKPGAGFKKILESVMDAQLEQVITTRKAALEYVKKNYPVQKYSGSKIKQD